MKILLVIPPYRTTDALVAALFPLPLAAVQLAAVLRDAGHEVAICDFLLPAQTSKTARPLSFEGKHAPPYMHYGLPLDECIQWLDKHARSFDAVGLCAGQCNLWETSAAIGQHVKALGLPLVVGGTYATTATERVLKLTGADVVVRGEGELVAARAFDVAIAGQKPQVIDGVPVMDLDALPMPAWDLVDLHAYPKANGKVRGVLTISRGCPWQCTFCSVHTVHGRKHRRKSVERAKAELLQLWALGACYLCFLDDNLFISSAAADELLGVVNTLRRSVRGFSRARFYVEEGIEVRVAAEPGLMRRIVEAGFENVALGVETLSGAARRAVKKPYTDAQLVAAVGECRTAGTTAKAFYIIGLPGDTVTSVCCDLVNFAALGMSARPNNLKLYPGTAAYQTFLSNGLVGEDYDWRLSTFHTPDQPGLNYAQIKRLKTVLGALGNAADEFGVDLFHDPLEQIAAAMRKRFKVDLTPDRVVLEGKMFRNTPYRHAAELLVLRQGAAGAESTVEKERVVAKAVVKGNEVQAGIVAALRGNGVAAKAAAKADQKAPTKAAAKAAARAAAEAPQAAQAGPVAQGSPAPAPQWLEGDACVVGRLTGHEKPFYDFLFSCPPYGNLEVYSEDPADLSNMGWDQFCLAYAEIIKKAAALLRPNRFACFVVGNFRDNNGILRDLVGLTVRSFEAAGCGLYNDAILVTMVGSLSIRAPSAFKASRKLGKTHQYVLVFVKGDPKQAVKACGTINVNMPTSISDEVVREAADTSSN